MLMTCQRGSTKQSRTSQDNSFLWKSLIRPFVETKTSSHINTNIGMTYYIENLDEYATLPRHVLDNGVPR